MPTLRELAAESIGRITRRGLEPQIAQIEAGLLPREQPRAVAPGHDGPAGVVVAVTGERLLVSSGAPFTTPALTALALAELQGATAEAEGDAWALQITHPHGDITVTGMFDRDAQRIAALLQVAASD